MIARLFLIESYSKLLVTRAGIKLGTSLISGRITLLTLELLALEWRKFYTFELEYLLRPVGQSWSNCTCNITGGGERLHNVLRQIEWKLLCPWQQKAPIDLWRGTWCLHLFSGAFDPILFLLADNEYMHKISDEFKFRPDRTTNYGVSCPWASRKIPIY